MSATTGTFRRQLRNIVAEWPADPFRPNVQLKTLLASLTEHPNLTPVAVNATQALQKNAFMHKVRTRPSLPLPSSRFPSPPCAPRAERSAAGIPVHVVNAAFARS